MCGGGGSPPPPPPPLPAPPPPVDTNAAARAAEVSRIRAAQSGGTGSLFGTSPMGLSTETPSTTKSLLGS